MTETCSYCYKVMLFGLKNAGTTYQRLMDKVLAPMLGINVQAYVDDMVVTSQERGRHTADLKELFATVPTRSSGVMTCPTRDYVRRV